MIRQPYIRYKIQTLNQSVLIQEEEYWRLKTLDGKVIFRVWLMGIVTHNFQGENNFVGFKMEDGTGAINLKSWDGRLDSVSLWDKIEVLGSLRINTSEVDEQVDVYIFPEILNVVENDNWFLFHKTMILKNEITNPVQGIRPATLDGISLGVPSIEDLKNKIISLVKSLDDGSGVHYDKIVEGIVGVDETHIWDAVVELLQSGDFFTPKNKIYSYIGD